MILKKVAYEAISPDVEGLCRQSAPCLVHTPVCIWLSGGMDPTEVDGIIQTTEEEMSFEYIKMLVKISKEGAVLNLTVTVLWVEE